MEVRWRAAALSYVRRFTRFIDQEYPVAARRVARELVQARDSLIEHPLRGRPGSTPGTRELVAVHTYVIVYRIVDDAVLILRIWHAAQDRP